MLDIDFYWSNAFVNRWQCWWDSRSSSPWKAKERQGGQTTRDHYKGDGLVGSGAYLCIRALGSLLPCALSCRPVCWGISKCRALGAP